LPELSHNLYRHVAVLSKEIGSRSLKEYEKLTKRKITSKHFFKEFAFFMSCKAMW
jgi:hypothetical protein